MNFKYFCGVYTGVYLSCTSTCTVNNLKVNLKEKRKFSKKDSYYSVVVCYNEEESLDDLDVDGEIIH